MNRTVLSPEQVSQYRQQGYLLVSGLISEEVADSAEAAMWRLLGLSPEDPVPKQNTPPNHRSYDVPELVACYTPEFLAAAAQLGGDDPATYRAPSRAYIINVYPHEGDWTLPSPHIDHALKEHGHKTFPRAFRVAAMTYLSDVERHGGATVVWAQSHRKIEALARSQPEHYEYMWALGQDIHRLDLGEPVEVIARRGDVLFYHYLCAHSGSKNVRHRPRFALNMKW